MKYDITYLSCEQCQARIHCDDCALKLRESTIRMPGVADAQFNLQEKTMVISCQPDGDEDDVLDALEDLGVLV